jgi:hypothetical protein
MPDVYNKYFSDIIRVKNNTLMLLKVQVKQSVGDRMRLVEFHILSDLLKNKNGA